MQESVVTEAELVAAINCVQEMLFVRKLIISIGMKVKTPMILYFDNKGAKDLINNWSVGGRMRQIEVKNFYLGELKEKDILKVQWVKSEDNCSNIFTKNLNGFVFNKHLKKFCGENPESDGNLKREDVGITVSAV
jgi:hypothetical protein